MCVLATCDIDKLRLPASLIEEMRIGTPAKILKRRNAMVWDENLTGCAGHVYKVAIRVLYLHWKHHGKPFLLPNGMLLYDGVSRYSKYRALPKLERLGLITVAPNMCDLATYDPLISCLSLLLRL
jgi:hypothetical protein